MTPQSVLDARCDLETLLAYLFNRQAAIDLSLKNTRLAIFEAESCGLRAAADAPWWVSAAYDAKRAAHSAFKACPGLRVLLILAAILLPAYVQAQDSTPKLLAIYGGASLLDLGSTEYGLARNAREGNPLMQNRAVRIGTQAGIVALMTVATRHAQKTGHPNRAKVLKWGFVAVKGALFVHNVRQAR